MAYNHHVARVADDVYRLSWTIDGKVKGSRLRYPRTTMRMTDTAGALRFARKWNVLLLPKELREVLNGNRNA